MLFEAIKSNGLSIFIFVCLCTCIAIVKRLTGKKKADSVNCSLRKDDISAKYTDKAQTKAVEDVQTANQTYHDNSACRDEKSQDSSVDIEKARSVVNDTAAHPDDEEKEAVAQFNNSAPDIFPAAEGGVHEEIWTEDTQNKLEQKNIFVGECKISETLTIKVYKYRYGCPAERAVNCKKCCSGIDNSTHTCCSVYFIRQDQTGKLYYHFKEYIPYKVREFLEDSDYDVSGRDRIISQMKWIFQSTEEKLYLSVLKELIGDSIMLMRTSLKRNQKNLAYQLKLRSMLLNCFVLS